MYVWVGSMYVYVCVYVVCVYVCMCVCICSVYVKVGSVHRFLEFVPTLPFTHILSCVVFRRGKCRHYRRAHARRYVAGAHRRREEALH